MCTHRACPGLRRTTWAPPQRLRAVAASGATDDADAQPHALTRGHTHTHTTTTTTTTTATTVTTTHSCPSPADPSTSFAHPGWGVLCRTGTAESCWSSESCWIVLSLHEQLCLSSPASLTHLCWVPAELHHKWSVQEHSQRRLNFFAECDTMIS